MNLVYSKKLIEILTTGKESVKYTLNFFDGKYILTPPKSSEYYKPVIVISNIEDLETKLKEYFDALKSLYDLNSDTKYYMDYYYRVLINNLTNSDSLELEKFVNLRTSFLNDNTFDLEVTVDADKIKSIRLVNLSESTSAMFPLMEPALESLTSQIYSSQSLDDIQYSEDQKYTSMILLNAIESALKKAENS